jgi:hypothetical protein
MAATTHGTAYLYGVDGSYIANAQISSISLKKSDKINEYVENNSGQVASSRHDDQQDMLDVTYKITSSYSRPTIAAKVTITATGHFDGEYRIESFDETKQAKGFVECKLTLVKDEYLTLT